MSGHVGRVVENGFRMAKAVACRRHVGTVCNYDDRHCNNNCKR